MYVPAVDRPLDEREWREFLAAQGFGTLAVPGANGALPAVTATQFVVDGDVVLVHVAAANSVVAALAADPRAVLCAAGDWAYVPSSWKAIGSEDPARGLPTTYFAAVAVSGRCELVEDPDELAALLRRQLAALQPHVEVLDPLEAHRVKLAGIRGVRLHIDDVEAKFKFGGNVDESHRRAVIGLLEARDGPGDRAAAAYARRRVSAPEGPSAFTRESR